MAVPSKTIPIIFADDTSLLITSPNTSELQKEFTTTNSVDRGQREQGSGAGSPLVWGLAQFANG
jgi:hypothetical protein